MKIHIADNIRSMRKQRNMMQEQLAEALGVSIAAVSKWERGVATPELNYIAEMADLFGISMDALIGYQVQSGTAKDLENRIHELQRKKEFEEAATEAEKALIRYPNHFAIVYRCGAMYKFKGIDTNHMPSVERAIELLNHAILLLSQNTDPEIDEYTIQSEIAQCYIALGKKDQGLEILKKYNANGVHNALIGLTYSLNDCYKPEEAEKYLLNAFADSLSTLVQTMIGYVNYYARKKDFNAALDTSLWLIRYLESIKDNVEKVSYVDKLRGLLYAECAHLSEQLGKTKDIKPYLRISLQIAKAFDAAPVYNTDNLKFCIGDTSTVTAYDDIGSTVMDAIENQQQQESWSEDLCRSWEKMKAEL